MPSRPEDHNYYDREAAGREGAGREAAELNFKSLEERNRFLNEREIKGDFVVVRKSHETMPEFDLVSTFLLEEEGQVNRLTGYSIQGRDFFNRVFPLTFSLSSR